MSRKFKSSAAGKKNQLAMTNLKMTDVLELGGDEVRKEILFNNYFLLVTSCLVNLDLLYPEKPKTTKLQNNTESSFLPSV